MLVAFSSLCVVFSAMAATQCRRYKHAGFLQVDCQVKRTAVSVFVLLLVLSYIDLQEANRPFDEEYDDDFEGEPVLLPPRKREAGNSMRGGRWKKRRPGLIVFDGDGEEDML